MRMTQIHGLTKETEKFLRDNVEMIPDLICANCKEIVSSKQNKKIYASAKDAGLFNDGPDLWEYNLKDNRIVREKLNKYQPWSSGPNLFIDLVDEKGNILYEWSEEGIYELI